MADLNFVLPMTKDDLLECNSPPDRYSVSLITEEKHIFKKLNDAKRDLQSDNDTFVIFKHFDVIFSALFHFTRIDSHAQKRSWHVTVRACSQFKEHLEVVFEAAEIDPIEKKKCVNALKMLVYLLTQHITNFETLLDKKSSKEEKKLTKPKASAKGKRQSQGAGEGSLEFDWAEESRDAMVLLHHVMQLPIQKLWSTPLVDEQFVGMVGNCCYKLLDDPDIHLVKLKPMRDLIFDVLGILVKSHVHTTTFVSTIVKALKGTENVNSSSVLAKGVLAIAQKYHIQSLVCCVVNEVATNGIPEFSSDSSAARSYSDFLLHLAEGDPVMMMPGIDILLPLLDQDPYQLRNCVLSVLAAVLQQNIKLGNLEDEKKKAFCDEIFTTLLEHLLDSNTFVRSKVCQIWINLFSVRAVPIPLHPTVLKVIVGRLEDKSAQVRKFSMQLVTMLLEEHNYVVKNGVAEIKKRFEANTHVLAMMEKPSQEITLDDVAEKTWKNMEDEVEASIIKCLESGTPHEEVLEAASIKSALEACRRFLAVRNFTESIETLNLCEIGTTSPHSTFPLEVCERVKLYKGVIKRIMFGDEVSPSENAPSETSSSESSSAETSPAKAASKKAAHGTAPNSRPNSEDDAVLINPFSYINASEKDIDKILQLVKFLKVSYKVGNLLNIAVPRIRILLTSSVASDVTEAVDFFTSAHHLSMSGISEGLQDMLNLIWSPDETVRSVIGEAFRFIYLSPEITDSSRSLVVVNNLTQLVLSPTFRLREKAALEMLMLQWIEKNHLASSAFLILWDRVYMRVKTSEDERRAALIILTMAARSDTKRAMLKNNMEELIDLGFGKEGHKDFRLALHTCQILSNLAAKRITDDADSIRMPNDHRMFTKVTVIILKGLKNFSNNQYCPMAIEALNLIFKLADRPDQIFEALAKDLVKDVIDTGPNGKSDVSGKEYGKYFPVILSRLLQCIGHIGVLLFQYLDKDIYSQIKKQRAANKKDSGKKMRSNKRLSASFVSRQSANSFATTTTDKDDELEGITAEDEDAELIKGSCDKQILSSSHFLGNLSQLVSFIVTHEVLYQDVKLRTSAIITLGKMMAISQTFCEKNQETLINYALKDTNPGIRSNGLLIIRDLAFRFPTLMEPSISHLYARLHDESREVRSNAMAALSSLILTEMVKAKSNIGHLARCIVGEDLDMVQQAKNLFQMMSDKGNQLYNALPDIISKLSNSEEKVEEEEFRTILKYIISLIQKDRQHELLVEKLCARFKLTVDERQWRDLGYCLSLLTYSDRSLRKLLENMPNYADKLQHQPLFDLMQTIVDQTTKQAKPEMKALLDEFNTRLLNCQVKGIDDGACTQKLQKDIPGKSRRTQTKKSTMPSSTKKRGRRPRASSTTSESENDSDNVLPAAKTGKSSAKTPAHSKARTPARSSTSRKKAVSYRDDSSSNDD